MDVSTLRAEESSVAADFDLLAGQILSGRQPLVVKGFNIGASGVIGAPATSLQLNTAGGVIMHWGASESGTIFNVADTAPVEVLNTSNANVQGSFSASATNFVGLDLLRSADTSTDDNVAFWNPVSKQEVSRLVPLARVLRFVIVIGTTDFVSQPTVLPLAKVVTDANNAVVSITDARPMAFRLGSGGNTPSIFSSYSWPAGRVENTSGDVFYGADKTIGSAKEWQDAVMTRLWEIGGGQNWYTPAADRNVNLIWTGSPFTGGENFEWDGTNLHWKGLRWLFDQGPTGVSTNDVADQLTDLPGSTNLADGDVLYVDLDRTATRTGGTALVAKKSSLTLLGTPTIPGSRQIMAWRNGSLIYTRNWRYPIGTTSAPATTTSLGIVKISRDYTGTDTGALSGVGTPVAISDRGGVISIPSTYTGAAGLRIIGGPAAGFEVHPALEIAPTGLNALGVTGVSTFAHHFDDVTMTVVNDSPFLNGTAISARGDGSGATGVATSSVAGLALSASATSNGNGANITSDTGIGATIRNGGTTNPALAITKVAASTTQGILVTASTTGIGVEIASTNNTALYAHAGGTGIGLDARAVSSLAANFSNTSTTGNATVQIVANGNPGLGGATALTVSSAGGSNTPATSPSTATAVISTTYTNEIGLSVASNANVSIIAQNSASSQPTLEVLNADTGGTAAIFSAGTGSPASSSAATVKVAQGHATAPALAYTVARTGKTIIGAAEFQDAGGGTLLGTATGSSSSIPYRVYSGSGTPAMVAGVHLPRGATITGIELAFSNTNVGSSSVCASAGAYFLQDVDTTAVGMNVGGTARTTIATNAGFSLAGTTSVWTAMTMGSPGAMPVGRAGAGNASWIYIEVTLASLSGVRFMGARITYTYTEIDFET